MQKLLRKMGIDPEVIEDAVRKDLDAMPGVTGSGFTATALAGGASVRGFVRLDLNGSSEVKSMVLMVLSDPDPAKGIEEVMEEGAIKELPFINVHRHLEGSGISVPELYHYNTDRGILYLEDCGRVHLRQAAESDDPSYKEKAYKRAIDELVKIHVDASQRKSEEFLGFMVRFDRKLLRWELDHFTEFAIEARFPNALTEEDREEFARHFERITEELREGPYTLQHRDYMLDNLMLVGGGVKVLDFQDALMGPVMYDMACLLYDRDTSTLLGDDLIRELVEYYIDKLEERAGQKQDRELLWRNFDLCVIHRMLKVVGRFHFIDIVKKRPEYLDFVPHMLPAITKYLGRSEQDSELLGIIRKYLPELRGV